ncbi:MAG: hypothetical protein ACYCYE_04620 [Clostridia bacterium]
MRSDNMYIIVGVIVLVVVFIFVKYGSMNNFKRIVMSGDIKTRIYEKQNERNSII